MSRGAPDRAAGENGRGGGGLGSSWSRSVARGVVPLRYGESEKEIEYDAMKPWGSRQHLGIGHLLGVLGVKRDASEARFKRTAFFPVP